MNKHAIWHQAKSHLSYAYDHNTLHILLQTSSEDSLDVSLVYGDPFEWGHVDSNFTWIHHKETMAIRYRTQLFNYYFLSIKPPYKRVKYGFLIKDQNQTYYFGTQGLMLKNEDVLFETYDLSAFFNFPFLNHEDVMQTPAWAKHMIWYQIFPDRFFTYQQQVDWEHEKVLNHTRFGGDLKGITDKLPYLSDLGIQGIYFTPIFKASSMHKYDTIDYFTIDPDFGTNEDLKILVDTAHKLGIKVMLDGVFNHTGFFDPMFQDVVKHGEASRYKDCFFIDTFPVIDFELDKKGFPIKYQNAPKRYKTFGFTPMMPKWNTSSDIVSSYLLDVVSYWIKEFHIDGWRLDVSNEVSHDFLRAIRKRARSIRSDIFILGENWDASLPWLLGDQMDAVMNYDLSIPLWQYLEHKIDTFTFVNQLQLYLSRTPKHVIESMFNLVGTHDTLRIKRRLQDQSIRVKLAYAMMFIHAGSPNIYYGDEIGLTGEHDPDNRRPMIWDTNKQDLDMFSFMKTLIHLKKNYPTFNVADFQFDIIDDVLFMYKTYDHQSLLCIFNNTKDTHELPHITKLYEPLINTCTQVLEPYTFYIGVKHEINH